jgi:hypothetical protein
LGDPPTLRVRSKLLSAAKAVVATTRVRAAVAARTLKVIGISLWATWLDVATVKKFYVRSVGRRGFSGAVTGQSGYQLLLQDDGVAGVEAGEDLGFCAVGDAGLDGDLATTGLLLGVGDLDSGIAIVVVHDGLLRDSKDVFVFVEEDLGVGGHIGFEFAAGVVDGDAYLEGGDVVLFDAKRGDLGDLAEEGLVLEGLDLDACWLTHVDFADVCLVDLALYVNLASVADRHDQGGRGTEDEDGADGVSDLDVAGEDGAVHGRGDGGVTELLFELLEGCLVLRDLCLGLAKLGGVDVDLRDGLVAGVGGEEVLLLGVIEGLLGDDAFLRHLEGAVVGVFVHGQVGSFGVDLVVLDGGGGGAGVGLGGGEHGLLGGDLVEDLLLVELGEDLTLVDVRVDVGVQAGDDAGGFGLDLDLGNGLDLAGGNNGAGNVSTLGLSELRGFELCGVAARGCSDAKDDGDDEDGETRPEPDFPSVFTLCGQGSLPQVL